jgi:phenylacetic acid degradation operon negative regulatory protein
MDIVILTACRKGGDGRGSRSWLPSCLYSSGERTIVSRTVTPGAPDRGRSVRLVPYLFGVAATDGRSELPGPVLVTMLGDLGLSRVAARALVARMQRDGQLAGERHGRVVHYRLVGVLAESFQWLHTGAIGPTWLGYFHTVLYQVPERHRAFRDRLRRTAQLVGYGLLQQGVLICPADRRDLLATVLADIHADSEVYFGELHLDAEAAARAAAAAWELDALNRLFRGHLRTLRAATRRTSPPPNGDTLRRLSDLVTTPLVDSLLATGLPPELAPPDWILPDLRRAIEQLYEVYLPPTVTYLRGLLAT